MHQNSYSGGGLKKLEHYLDIPAKTICLPNSLFQMVDDTKGEEKFTVDEERTKPYILALNTAVRTNDVNFFRVFWTTQQDIYGDEVVSLLGLPDGDLIKIMNAITEERVLAKKERGSR